MILPDVFEDVDGAIVSWSWSFETGIERRVQHWRIIVITRFRFYADKFRSLQSRVAWKTPGMKNVTVEVEDNDGNRTHLRSMF